MDQRSAFDAARRILAEQIGAELLSDNFDQECFGNWWISYRLHREMRLITADRMQLFNESPDTGKCEMLFGDLRAVDEAALRLGLLSALGLNRQS